MVQMTTLNHEREFLRSEVEGASPVRLVVLLYNKVITELRVLREMLADGSAIGDCGLETEECADKFRRTREILTYLLDSLDPRGGEVTTQLASIYYFSLEQLLTAQMEKSYRYIDSVLPQIEKIREGWVELEQTQNAGN